MVFLQQGLHVDEHISQRLSALRILPECGVGVQGGAGRLGDMAAVLHAKLAEIFPQALDGKLEVGRAQEDITVRFAKASVYQGVLLTRLHSPRSGLSICPSLASRLIATRIVPAVNPISSPLSDSAGVGSAGVFETASKSITSGLGVSSGGGESGVLDSRSCS